MRALIAFLITDCCDGHPEICNFAGRLRESDCCLPASGATSATRATRATNAGRSHARRR
jgi:hypothetical protein